MSLFGGLFNRRTTAPIARERLQVLLQHERTFGGDPDLMVLLQKDILDAIRKHFPVESDKVHVKLDRSEDVSTLEIDVEMPNAAPTQAEARSSA